MKCGTCEFDATEKDYMALIEMLYRM